MRVLGLAALALLTACDGGAEFGSASSTSMTNFGCVLDDQSAALGNAACLNAALADGPVELDVGTLWVDGEIYVQHSLRGVGPESVVKSVAQEAQERIFVVRGQDGLEIRDLSIDGNGNAAAYGEHAANVFIWNSRNITVRDIYGHDAQGDNVQIYADGDGVTEYVTVRDCRFDNRGRAAVSITGTGASHVSIEQNHARAGIQPTATSVSQGACVDLEPNSNSEGAGDIIIRGNDCEGDIQVGHQALSRWDRVVVVDNLVRNGTVLIVQALNVAVSGNVITGTGDGGGYGIIIKDVGPTRDTGEGVIANNVIADVGAAGFPGAGILFSSSGGFSDSLGRMVISGNSIHRGAGNAIDLEVPTRDVVMVGNLASESGNVGIGMLNVEQFLLVGNLVVNPRALIGVLVTARFGQEVREGLILGNAVRADDTTSRTAIKLDGTDGILDSVLVLGNDLADNLRWDYALWVLAGTNVAGRSNIVDRTKPPEDLY